MTFWYMLPFTRANGTGGAFTVFPAQWAWPADGQPFRVFPPRIRNEYWVERGHSENGNPARDTRDMP